MDRIKLFLSITLFCFFNFKAQNTPVTQTLSGATTISCPQDNTLTLGSSEVGFNYYLQNTINSSEVDGPVTGTGNALTFQTGVVYETSNYYVVAENTNNTALNFDGIDDYVVTQNAVIPTSGDFSISFWGKYNQALDGSLNMEFFSQGTSGNALYLGVYNGQFRAGDTWLNTGITHPTDTNWHHYALVKEATNTHLYIDGVLMASLGSAITNPANNEFRLGRQYGAFDEYLNGQIDHFTVWDKALSLQEVQETQTTFFNGTETNLSSYFTFDDLGDNSLTNFANGNSNNGSLVNMDSNTDWVTGKSGIRSVVSNSITITRTILAPVTIYVDKNASGNNDGSTWNNAFTSLTAALNIICGENDTILIANGTYQEAEYIVPHPITIKGGYPTGGGVQDIVNNPTILDGNDSHRVLNATHTIGTLFLEGITIQNGLVQSSKSEGGGIYTTGSITLRNVVIQNNSVSSTNNTSPVASNFSKGGGIFSTSGTINLVNCILDSNTVYTEVAVVSTTSTSPLAGSDSRGGGIYNASGLVTITNSTIKNNTVGALGIAAATVPGIGSGAIVHTYGGGIFTDGNSVTIKNTIISDNTAYSDPRSGGSSSSRGGGIYASIATISTINSIITNNIASTSAPSGTFAQGGGIFTNSGSIMMINSVASKNKVFTDQVNNTRGGGVYGITTLQNSILWGNLKSEDGGASFTANEHENNTLTTSYSLIKAQDLSAENGINASISGFDPLFVDEVNEDFRLQTGSPLINTGLDSYNTSTADLDDNIRKIGTIDIGPYEFNGAANANTSWTGATNTLWEEVGNWSNGLPNAMSNVTIPNGLANYPTITNTNTATTFNIKNENGASLVINTDKNLTVENNLTNNGNITVNSDATSSGSLVVKGTASGKITYNRYVTDNWHIVGAPVIEQNINEFAVVDSATNQIIQNGDNTKYAIAPYNNDIATNNWEYVLVADVASAGDFENAKGYAMKRALSGTYSFTGTIENNDKTVNLTDGSKNNWNLIANPYPSFLKFNNLVDVNANLLLNNISSLNPSSLAIYIWNDATSSYKPYNHASTDLLYIAPGQAFFVNSKIGGATFSFSKNLQTHHTGNVFAKTSSDVFEIDLQISDGEHNKSTSIKYLENSTKGLDLGYDAQLFDGEDVSFEIYTQLLDNNQNNPFALQCLPKTNIEEQIIPIGINANTNSTLLFTINAKNIPSGIGIYLEDRKKNTFARLDDENQKYQTTLLSAQKGVGRFYLHTSSKALTNEQLPIALKQTKIWVSENRTLNISNLSSEKVMIKLYDLLGREVYKSILSNQSQFKGIYTLNIPKKISSTTYLVHLQTKNGTKTQKIILK